jgi:hypothetical protein
MLDGFCFAVFFFLPFFGSLPFFSRGHTLHDFQFCFFCAVLFVIFVVSLRVCLSACLHGRCGECLELRKK